MNASDMTQQNVDASDFYAMLRFEEAALALRTVFRLNLVDEFGTNSLSESDFQTRFQLTNQASRTFGALLRVMHVLESPSDGRLQTTEVARSCLASDAKLTRRPYLQMGSHPEVDDFIRVLQGECESLPPALYGRDNEPETLMDVAEVAEAVSLGLASRANCFAAPLARAIAEYAQPQQTTLADIGAGSPHVVVTCLEAMPQLAVAKLVDRANGMKYVRRMLGEIGEQSILERLELCEQDFFQTVPAADIYNISNTAHDWLESEYLEIMANVRKAISPNGLVCIHEPLMVTSWATKEEWCEALWMACYAVTLFRLTRGKGSCYTVSEHDAIQRKAGFARIAAPIGTTDGCTALFYGLPDSDQDSTFARKIGKLHDSEVKRRAKHAVARKRVRHAKTRG